VVYLEAESLSNLMSACVYFSITHLWAASWLISPQGGMFTGYYDVDGQGKCWRYDDDGLHGTVFSVVGFNQGWDG